jgi:hypothetical protein
MRISFALSIVLLLSHSASAVSRDVCEPTVITSGREETVWLKDTRVIGEAAVQEMKAMGKLTQHRDGLGRLMYVDSRVLIRKIDGTTPESEIKGVHPFARIERYCSRSDEVDAACVDLCIRWTHFEDPRI